MQIVPSGDVIGADVVGVDLTAPLGAADVSSLAGALAAHGVICIKDQRLPPGDYVAFARRFGAIERIFLEHYAHPDWPEILLVSNIQEHGRNIGHADAGRVWHTDMSYIAEPPRATMLYALEVPRDGDRRALGDTHFASAAAAYDALEEETKALIAGRQAVHRVAGRRKRLGTSRQDDGHRAAQPDVVHPVARTHPITGRKCIYVSEGECVAIDGMADVAAEALIARLQSQILDPSLRHTHRWTEGDLLIWDNCAVQHIADFDYSWPTHRRLMHRITVGGEATF